MKNDLSPPNGLFVTFMTSRMLNALQGEPEQDLDKLYASIIKSKKGYDKYDWDSVKASIFEKVEAAALEAGIGMKSKEKSKEKTPKAKKEGRLKPKPSKAKKEEETSEEEEAEESEAAETQLPKKMKLKKGAEQAFVGNEVFVSGKPGKVGVKCAPGFKANERVVDEKTKAYGCKRTRKGEI